MSKKEVFCFCGSTASLKSNSLLYGKEYGNGKAWICDKFPVCRGSVGTHPDGAPLGTIANEETKEWRMKAHAVIDPLWKSGMYRRRIVYGKLSKALGKQIHIGESDKETCQKIIEIAPKLFPIPNIK